MLVSSKAGLIREARVTGLLNKKNKSINIETTLEIITQLSMIPLEWRFKYFKG